MQENTDATNTVEQITKGDWLKRDGRQFQIRAVEDSRLLVGNSDSRAKWYSKEKTRALLAQTDATVFHSDSETLTFGQTANFK